MGAMRSAGDADAVRPATDAIVRRRGADRSDRPMPQQGLWRHALSLIAIPMFFNSCPVASHSLPVARLPCVIGSSQPP